VVRRPTAYKDDVGSNPIGTTFTSHLNRGDFNFPGYDTDAFNVGPIVVKLSSSRSFKRMFFILKLYNS